MQLPSIDVTQLLYPPEWLQPTESVIDGDWRSVSSQIILANAIDATPQSQATVVRILATTTHLWLRFDCADADAWATLQLHDTPLYTEEVVEMFIAYGDQAPHQYYELQTNPLNAQFDGIIHNPDEHRSTMTLDLSWNPIWFSCTRVDSAGWTSVWSVPWHALGRNNGLGTWRCNFYRIDRPRHLSQSETSAWSPTVRTPVDFHVPSRFGYMNIK